MKVTGGLVGIILNPSARSKFFLIAPELAKLAEQAKDMAGVSSKIQTHHRNLTTAVLNREDKKVEKLLATIKRFTNPFLEESKELFKLVTKVVIYTALHAISGADNTGSFSGKGKLAFWKVFNNVEETIISELEKLGTTVTPTAETIASIETFVCQLYLPMTTFTKVKELRWWLFKKKQAQSERLPPTQAALHEAILRAHYQLIVCNHDRAPNPELPPPESYGWERNADEYLPVMTKLPPAPEAIIQLVKCNCAKQRCSNNRCQCRKAGLKCTDLCTCSDDDESCSNIEDEDDHLEQTDGDSSDEDN
ncbi:hypothetical protein QZH41_020119 [Actinostola sp. cb2023]|nr:hypothetical protein QZH41_020119 [Actinostola sp. cb2023]